MIIRNLNKHSLEFNGRALDYPSNFELDYAESPIIGKGRAPELNNGHVFEGIVSFASTDKIERRYKWNGEDRVETTPRQYCVKLGKVIIS